MCEETHCEGLSETHLNTIPVYLAQKAVLITPYRRQRGEDVQLLLILSSILDWGEWSASRPCRALPPRKNPLYAFDTRLGGSRSRSGLAQYRSQTNISFTLLPGLYWLRLRLSIRIL
jgi:hypothetical protein